jgi:formamidopyrimidine-DNA glycosylase
MPELPEVQTIISDLNKKIKGDTVTGFWSDWSKAIKGKSLEKFKKEIKGRKILEARRIGKNIFIDLSGNKTLHIHLKMTGHLLVKQAMTKKQETKNKNYFADRVNQYIHHKWFLKSVNCRLLTMKCQKTLEFSDVRKFAKIVLDDTEKINNLPEVEKLGIDAMNKNFTLKKFKEILSRRKNKSVGLVLMEQELIAGIGNIYRSEILYEAGVLPTRIVKKLKDSEIEKIYKATIKVLKKAVKLRGTSDSDYRDTAGAPGNFQKVMRVYRQTGKICPKCDTIVRRSALGQRSVFFCPGCQK